MGYPDTGGSSPPGDGGLCKPDAKCCESGLGSGKGGAGSPPTPGVGRGEGSGGPLGQPPSQWVNKAGGTSTLIGYNGNIPGHNDVPMLTMSDCVKIPLKSGGMLSLGWNRWATGLNPMVKYVGAAAVTTFDPCMRFDDAAGVKEYGPWGTTTFSGWPTGPNANSQSTRQIIFGSSPYAYFQVYETTKGVYFEYFGLVPGNWAGRFHRQYDLYGNEVVVERMFPWYPVADMHSVPLVIRDGDVGRVHAYFYYPDWASWSTQFLLERMVLADQDEPANSRTVNYTYNYYVYPHLLESITYPNGCKVEYYGFTQPFNNNALTLWEKDAEGYTTSFEYGPYTDHAKLKKSIEPEGRITYYDFVSGSETRVTELGRATTYYVYARDAGKDLVVTLLKKVDAEGNVTEWGYDPTLNRVDRELKADGSLVYFQYQSAAATVYAPTARISSGGGGGGGGGAGVGTAVVSYNQFTPPGSPPKYKPTVMTGPRHTASYPVVTYWDYNNQQSPIKMTDPNLGVKRIAYDSLGRRTRLQDERGNATYYHYGTFTGHLDCQAEADGSTTYFGYNSFRDLLREVSPRWTEQSFAAFTTYHAYDQLSRRTRTVDPLGNVTYFEWTNRGDLFAEIDPRGTERVYTHNGLRLMTGETVTDAAGTALKDTTHGYDIYKNRTQTLDGRGNATYFFYDQIDRLTAEKDALGNTTYHFYDRLSRRTTETDARGNSVYYFYDGLNRNFATRNAQGALTYYFYDTADNRTHLTNVLGDPTYFFYDKLDRADVVRDALGNPTYYQYDAVGNRTVLMDARFNVTYFFYDSRNRLNATRDALTNATYFLYDARGNRTHILDARQNPAYFYFDTLDRLQADRDAVGNCTYLFYDATGNATEVRNAKGNTTYFVFDGLHRPQTMRDSVGNSTYFFYDLNSNRTHVRNALGHAIYFGYDALDRLARAQDALGNAAYYFYDAVGNLTELKDARRNTTYFFFDSLNRPTVLRDALANSIYYFYDAIGNRTEMRDARGYTTYFFFDRLSRLSSFRDGIGNRTYFHFDAVSNTTHVKNALFHTTYFGFDAINRLSRIQDTIGGTTYYEFDSAGNRTKIVDANGNELQDRFDKVNRTDAMRHADAGSVYFFYDEVNLVSRIKDSRGNATYFGYDGENRLQRYQDPLDRTLYFEYDAIGRRSRNVGAEGESSTHTYDAADRRTNVAYTAAGSVVTAGIRGDAYYVYDEVSNLKEMGDLWGVHRMGYDALNRITYYHTPYKQTIYYEYDQSSNLKALVYPSTAGRQTAYFDQLDRLQRVKATTGAHTAYYEYNAVSNVSRMVYPNNQNLFVTYDDAERTARWRYAKNSGQTLSYFDYTRDAKGLATKCVREATHTVYYRYDATDRLVAEIWSKAGTPEVYAYRYEYDLGGNRVRARMNGSDTYYSYDQANQLRVKGTNAAYASPTYYIYDRNGSLTNLVEPSGATYFAYNATGLVARIRWRDATATYFFYDGRLQRYAMIANGTRTYFLWDDLNLLEERNAGGTVTERHTHGSSPIKGIGAVVQAFRPSQGASLQRIYPVMDPRGSITKWHQSDGTTVLASREYDSFGQIIPNSTTGTWPNRFGYQGQAWIEILSGNSSQRLLLSKFRIYDPTDGRFLQNEPLLNRRPRLHYMYVRNNPLRGVDPTGLWEEQGHFYTVYIVSRAAGMTHKEASVLAYYAQLPDEEQTFNATDAGLSRAKWGGVPHPMKSHWKDIQEVLHSLHGGDAIKRRDCLKKLLKEEKLKPWQKGLIIHAFGDAYAHSFVNDGKVQAYGGVTGHGLFPTAAGWVTNAFMLGNVFGGHPDSIGLHNNTYRKYVNDLYDVLKTDGGDPSRIGALENLADTFSRNRTNVEGEIAALRKLAIDRGYTSSYAPEASGEERLPRFERFHGDVTDKEIKEIIALIKKACGC